MLFVAPRSKIKRSIKTPLEKKGGEEKELVRNESIPIAVVEFLSEN